MLSVCIPVYNFEVKELVECLSLQAKSASEKCEIVIIDDGSQEYYRKKNEEFCSKEKYIKLEINIGRSAIRNLLVQHSSHNYLLFLDCDSKIIRGDFLDNYIKILKENPSVVVCGGRVYGEKPKSQKQFLRWAYGVKRESKSALERTKFPERSFMTNNFALSKEIFKTVKFNESLNGYGHEDTLFGFGLKKNNIKVLHVDNPILNGHLEENDVYIRNTEQGIRNLKQILEITQYNSELIEEISLLKTYFKIKRISLIIDITYGILRPIIRFFLIRGIVSIWLFNFYKLGLLSAVLKKVD